MTEKFLNQVFNDDMFNVLKSLPDDSVDMVYGDPDYNVGINYAGKSYTTKWNDYIDWYCELARESMRVLKPTGNLFFINYPKQNAYLRVRALDEIAYEVHDYVWVYNTNVGHSPRKFTTAHRSILHATKSKDNHFYKEQVAQPYLNPNDKRIQERIRNGHAGRMPYSWLYYDLVKNVEGQNLPRLSDSAWTRQASNQVLHQRGRFGFRSFWRVGFGNRFVQSPQKKFHLRRIAQTLLRNDFRPIEKRRENSRRISVGMREAETG